MGRWLSKLWVRYLNSFVFVTLTSTLESEHSVQVVCSCSVEVTFGCLKAHPVPRQHAVCPELGIGSWSGENHCRPQCLLSRPSVCQGLLSVELLAFVEFSTKSPSSSESLGCSVAVSNPPAQQNASSHRQLCTWAVRVRSQSPWHCMHVVVLKIIW